jgi:hypothetical protein
MSTGNTKGVYELFNTCVSYSPRAKQVAYLQQVCDNYAVRTILQGAFSSNIKFLLPDSQPPYSEGDSTMVETRLLNLAKKLDIFVENGRPVATQSKREQLWLELLESVHPQDAKLLIRMSQKQEPVKGITESLVREAFPDLLPAVVKKAAKKTKKAS